MKKIINILIILLLCFAISNSQTKEIRIGWIKYSGDWDCDPTALGNLVNEINQRTGYKVIGEYVALNLLDYIRSFDILIITGHNSFSFSNHERNILKKYIEEGGFLFIDDCNNTGDTGFEPSIRNEIRRIFGKDLVDLSMDHPIYSSFYEITEIPVGDGYNNEPLQGIDIDGITRIIYSDNDYTCCWENQEVHDIDSLRRDGAFKIGTNIVMYALNQGKGIPYLDLKVKFDDREGNGNGVLDGGEKAKLIVSISNTGDGTAFGTNLKITKNKDIVNLQEEFLVGNIAPNSTREVEIPISASIKSKNDTVSITIEAQEKRGFDSQPIKFSLPIREVKLPQLTLGDEKEISIIDTPRVEIRKKFKEFTAIKGNGNGIIENGEIVYLRIPVKNNGEGPALDVHPNIFLPENLELIDMDKTLGDIDVGEEKDLNIILKIPRKIEGNEGIVNLLLSLIDKREEIAPFSKTYALAYKENRPKIDIILYKIYDGTSTKSRGNKNGRIEQGEIIELEMIIENKGEIEVEDAEFSISTDKEGVVINQGTQHVESIKPNERVKLNFVFAVQRKTEPGRLKIELSMKEKDFEDNKIINLTIYEVGVKEVTLEKVMPEVGEKVWISTGIQGAGEIYKIVRNPQKKNIIYIATEKRGILKSEDSGKTWKEVNAGLKDLSIYTVVVDPVNPNIIYAGTKSKGIFKSEDGGKTWKEININIKSISSGIYPQIRNIVIDPIRIKRIYLGTQIGLYISEDSGNSWKEVKGLPSAEIRYIALNPNNPNIVYVALPQIIYYSEDSGTTWKTLSIPKDKGEIKCININPYDPRIIYVLIGGKIIRSRDQGINWEYVELDKSVKSIEINPIDPTVLYAVTEEGDIYITRDEGENWEQYGYEVREPGEKGDIQFLSVEEETGEIIAGGEEKIYELGEVEEKKILSMVHFDFDSDKLKSEAYPILDEVVRLLKEKEGRRVIITGHTDNIGTEEYNLGLSRRRAESVKKYLISKGISKDRIESYGYGESMPIASNDTEEGRSKNRRVEILIIGE